MSVYVCNGIYLLIKEKMYVMVYIYALSALVISCFSSHIEVFLCIFLFETEFFYVLSSSIDVVLKPCLLLFEDALIGIRDLFLKHPAELRLHKYAVIEKLRERIADDDKAVRETLYQLFKSVVFPSCKEVILPFSFNL